MIIAIPAIVAALTPVVKAALISAGIGAAVGGGIGAVGGAVEGYQEQGQINRAVLDYAGRGAFYGAKDGALVGGVFGPVGLVVGPVIAPATQFVDDIALQGFNVLDDVAKSAAGSIDDAAMVAGSAAIVDDAASPFLSGVRRKISSATSGIGPGFRLVRNKLNARFFSRLPDASATERYVYVMEDAANGLHKIGMTTKQPAIRLGKVAKDAKSKLDYVCIIRADKNSKLESALHKTFSSQKTPHPTPNYDSIEWFALSAAQVAAACSY